VHLTDSPDDTAPFASSRGDTALMSVSRKSVGRFLSEAATTSSYVGQVVSLSGSGAA
jgi:hypothetical protein